MHRLGQEQAWHQSLAVIALHTWAGDEMYNGGQESIDTDSRRRFP
jgi:hypothetical protein